MRIDREIGSLNPSDIQPEPRAVDCLLPLTAFQKTWFDAAAKAGKPYERMRMCIASMRIFGPLEASTLQSSIEQLVRRHEALRARIVYVEGIPKVIIGQSYTDHFQLIHLGTAMSSGVEGEARRLAQDFLNEQVDLGIGPHFDSRLFRLSKHDHVFVLVIDHMFADAASHAVLSRELWSLYSWLEREQPLQLPELPVQYADYAIWEQRTYGAWIEKHHAYWTARLEGSPRITLPADFESSGHDEADGNILHFPFGKDLSNQLRDIAWRERTLLAEVVLTIYIIEMSRWCKCRDIILSFISNVRSTCGKLRNVIGPLIAPTHLRIVVDQDDTFVDLLKRVNRELANAMEHQHLGRVYHFIQDLYTELCFDFLPSNRKFDWIPSSLTLNFLPDNFAPVTTGNSAVSHKATRVESYPLKAPWALKFMPIFTYSGSEIGVSIAYLPSAYAINTVERFTRNLISCAAKFVEEPSASVSSVSSEE